MIIKALFFCFSPFFILNGYSWDNHFLHTQLILEQFQNLKTHQVSETSLDGFVSRNRQELLNELKEIDREVKILIPHLSGLTGEKKEITELKNSKEFLEYLRVNPNGIQENKEKNELIQKLFPRGIKLSALNVLVQAVDEPDQGLDIGLFEDNGTDYGRNYGFGLQPFGNPNLSFSSQAPFHMGFYHEHSLVNHVAPFLLKTYPLLRIIQFTRLSKFSFSRGETYWGYRFLGWGLHYIQDLSQPFHARVLPGVSVPRMLIINLMDILGWQAPKNNAVQLVSNRHLVFEKIVSEAFVAHVEGSDPFAFQVGWMNHSKIKSLNLSSHEELVRWIRSELTLQSSVDADELVEGLIQFLAENSQSKYVMNPKIEFEKYSKTEKLFSKLIENRKSSEVFGTKVRPIMERLNENTFRYVNGVLNH